MTCYFAKIFSTLVNNFSDMLFQVLSNARLGALSCELSLIKAKRRADTSSEVI